MSAKNHSQENAPLEPALQVFFAEQIDPKRPDSAAGLLAMLGHKELGEEYATACTNLSKCFNILFHMALKEEMQRDEYAAVLDSNLTLKTSKANQAKVWAKIQAIKDSYKS